MAAAVWYEYAVAFVFISPFTNANPLFTSSTAALYSASLVIAPNSFIFIRTVFVLFFIFSCIFWLSVSNGLYAFGEWFIPAKNAHSAKSKSLHDLLK